MCPVAVLESTTMIKHINRLAALTSPTRHAEQLRTSHPDTLAAVTSMMRHPRSLARPVATWRPPSTSLPGAPPLVLTLSRMRVGDGVRDTIRNTGVSQSPAYLVTVRITDPGGHRVPATTAEAWVRAMLADEQTTCVHQLTDEPTPTFCWLIDSRFTPLPSPATLFHRPAHAA